MINLEYIPVSADIKAIEHGHKDDDDRGDGLDFQWYHNGGNWSYKNC